MFELGVLEFGFDPFAFINCFGEFAFVKLARLGEFGFEFGDLPFGCIQALRCGVRRVLEVVTFRLESEQVFR